MSYFCATAIKIDPKTKTFRVKGGDNNVIPRYNEWTLGDTPLRIIPEQIDGGGLQFTTRSDKNIYYETLARKYAQKMFELTKLTAYDLYFYVDEDRDLDKYRKIFNDTIQDLSAYPDYIDVAHKKLNLLDNPEMMKQLDAIIDEFVKEACKPYK